MQIGSTPNFSPVVFDEPDHHLARRSSSAFAKYADASRRISFARRQLDVFAFELLEPRAFLRRQPGPPTPVTLG